MADLTGMMQAAAGGAGGGANYIEDVFSTYLYTGTGSAQTITNEIDLAGEGGLTWIKGRSGATDHALYDTVRGATKDLVSNSTAAETTQATGLTAFSGTGFSIGALAKLNTSSATYASWTFRKQPKFFDVVTYTGNGVDGRTIAHNLGSAPGFIIAKCTSMALDWVANPCTLGPDKTLYLNATSAMSSDSSNFTNTAATSTVFSVGDSYSTNKPGDTYVAYLFAHDAGGFGLTGTDNVVSCGSFTTDGSGNATVNLGYEPQWIMYRRSASSDNWRMVDSMRGFDYSNYTRLSANLADSEAVTAGDYIHPTATGFATTGAIGTSTEVIYIAIRRGPMKVPTDGTTVFTPVTATPGGSAATVTTNITTDLIITAERSHALSGQTYAIDRLRGSSSSDARFLATQSTAVEAASAGGFTFSSPTNIAVNDNLYPASGITNPVIYWFFSRAPGFFDEVCYTGTGSATTVAHNLAAVPELMIVKQRGAATDWWVYAAATGNTKYLALNLTNSATIGTAWNNTTPTSSVFSVGSNNPVNASAGTFVAYLFATCPGVSKVGSYTGTAATQVINCGFTTGARFVLIKRTDDTGGWYVWDSARGIIAGNDPYLLINSTAPEVTNTDYVDTAATGFELTSTAPAAINASGGSYIFWAVA